MRASLLVAGLLLVPAAFAGCLARPATPDAGAAPVAPAAATPTPSGAPPGAASGAPPPADPPHAAATAAGWPAVDAAKIRPGVQVVSPTGQCTSNFVYRSLDNASLYLGLAAHCVDGMKIGDAVQIDGGTASGTLAYSSWMTMKAVGEKDATLLAYNDFALVRVSDLARGMVHPAVQHFGGPTALADSSKVAMGDKVLTYGNSDLRQQLAPLSPHEGYVLSHDNAWTTEVYTVTPGVPGDSGSGVMLGDGRALGDLVTIAITPTTGSNGVSSLDLELKYAAEKAGLPVLLCTWQLLDAGTLPPL